MVDRSERPIAHFVGSIPLPDSESVFRTLSKAVGPHLVRLPDGETGIRKSWIRFIQDVLAGNSAIEVAKDEPPFRFTQWDGKVVREISPEQAMVMAGGAAHYVQNWKRYKAELKEI